MEVFKFYLVCFILIAPSVKIGQFLGWRGSSNRGSTPLPPHDINNYKIKRV